MKELSNVSIPYLSGHPFLQADDEAENNSEKMCQSPIYRDTHFYSMKELKKESE